MMSRNYSAVSSGLAQGSIGQSFQQRLEDQPFGGFWETLGQGTVAGVQESPGLGTVIRSFSLPITPSEADKVGVQAPKALTEDEYKSSPYFRTQIPWDESTTPERAAAKAAWFDTMQVRNQRLSDTGGVKGWGARIIGNVAGTALDPVNYIPVLGPAARTAAVARFGVVGGRVAVSAADAAINTAIADAAAFNTRNSLGDDLSFGDVALDVATAAFIGSVFGGVGGVRENRSLSHEGSALRNIQESQSALNDAVGSMLHDGDVRLSEPAMKGMTDIARRENPVFSPDLFASVDRSDLFSSTAVGRLIDSRPVAIRDLETQMRAFATEVDPELGTRFQNAETRFNEAQDRVAALEESLNARTEADAIALIDQTSGERVRKVEQELAESPVLSRKNALEAEREIIRQTISPDAIAKAENDFRIGPSKQVKQARKALVSTRQEYAKLQREMDRSARTHFEIRRNTLLPKTDITRPPEPPADPAVAVAATKVGKPSITAKQLADDFGIDEAGNFPELEDIATMESLGRLHPDEKAAINDAEAIMKKANIYADSMMKAVFCEIN